MSYELEVIKDDPVALWMMDRGNVPAIDSSKNQQTGALTGTLTKLMPLTVGSDFSVRFSTGVSASYELDAELYRAGSEKKAFSLEGWALLIPKLGSIDSDQVVLGSYGNTDGLILSGNTVKFRLKFTTAPSAEIVYELPTLRKVHMVGIYLVNSMRLYVNGECVEELAFTDEQAADTFLPTDIHLQTGATPGTQYFCINALAVYDKALTSEQIENHYSLGNTARDVSEAVISKDGIEIEVNRDYAEISMNQTWTTAEDFDSGSLVNAYIDIPEDTIYPMVDDDDLTLAGSWVIAFPLEAPDAGTLYGLVVNWDAKGVTVSLSLDAAVWTPIESGLRTSLIPTGFDPTDKDMFIKVEFDVGVDVSLTYLNSIEATVFSSGNILNNTNRVITLGGDVTINYNLEPFDLRDDAGIYLNGGSITIAPDSDTEFATIGTVEMWIKEKDTTAVQLKVAGVTQTDPTNATIYKNGVHSSTSIPQGEWILMHWVPTSAISSNITLTHSNLIIAGIVLYKDALTAGEVAEIFNAYTAVETMVVDDSASALDFDGSGDDVSIYTYDWAIVGAG